MNTESQVVFYGASNYLSNLWLSLRAKYAPVAFCDSDPEKQGMSLFNLPIMSLSQVLEKYPGCVFYVATSDYVKSEIFALLLRNNISKERILNYEEGKKYKSCVDLETHLYTGRMIDAGGGERGLRFCCNNGYRANIPPIVAYGETASQTWHNYLTARDGIIAQLNSPAQASASTDKIHTCVGCPNVREAYWGQRHLKLITLSFDMSCNFKCIYCAAEFPSRTKKELVASANENLEFFEYMVQNGHVTKDTTIALAQGENLVHPCRDTILDAIKSFPVIIYTNASVYSEKLAQVLSLGRSMICVSMDAGTRETFTKIKGVDAFEKVRQNLRSYSEAGYVELKYIYMPGINDNVQDVEGFLQLCHEINANHISISNDLRSANAFDVDAANFLAKFISETKNTGISYSLKMYGDVYK